MEKTMDFFFFHYSKYNVRTKDRLETTAFSIFLSDCNTSNSELKKKKKKIGMVVLSEISPCFNLLL